MATCLANGKFDLLHVGHFNLLMFCRRFVGFDGRLIVAIDTDDRIKELEGKYPLFTESRRAAQLMTLRLVDQSLVTQVCYFSSDDGLRNIIREAKPDFLVKGSEWTNKKIIGSELVDKVIFYQSETTDGIEKISSSTIIKTILDRYGKSSV